MKRKKRQQEQAAAQHGPPPPKTGLFRPFEGLKDKLPPPAPAPPSKRRVVPAAKPASEEREGPSFESAMSGVAPLERDHVPTRRSVPPPPPAEDEFEAAERFLSALVEGEVSFDFADTDEYLEGKVQGLDARLVQKLRRGQYAVEGHIDLHGLDRHEARVTLRDFVERARAAGKRCILVIHGRGLGSPDGIPVLRERMKDWLSRGAIGKRVLAFTSARPVDGGTGAVYVLLRR